MQRFDFRFSISDFGLGLARLLDIGHWALDIFSSFVIFRPNKPPVEKNHSRGRLCYIYAPLLA